MSVQQASRQLKITIPETLYQWLLGEAQQRAQDVSAVVLDVLEQYVQEFDLTRTRTWELCGTLAIAEPEAEYLADSNETGASITNYAEHVDDVLYEEA